MAKGCVHVHVRDGVVVNMFAHLTDLPRDGVVHMVPECTMSRDEFGETHPNDVDELNIGLNLGDSSVILKRPN
jgi:hypothetical protein